LTTRRHKSQWFFLDGTLYRSLAINTQDNYVKAYDYTDHRVKMFKWDETLHAKEKAYGLEKAGEMLNRKVRTMRFYIKEGIIQPTGVAQRGNRKPIYFMTKNDILEARDTIEQYSKKTYGRVPIPTREQLRSMLTAGSILYIKDGDDFVPVWQAKF